MLLGLYRVATDLGSPLLQHHLNRRVQRGKEDPNRLGERCGRASLPRPAGPLLWVHAASVGESLSALPLLGALLDERPSLHILMTTGTVTSAALMAERLPERGFHQFAPLDQASAWRRFFAHWRPDLGLLVESEIWPNLMLEAERVGLPLALINGRMSERSAARWRWGGKTSSRLLDTLTLCLARSETDAERLSALGAKDVLSPGDLKHAAPPLPVDETALCDLEAQIGSRPVWLAASTHPGEEMLIQAARKELLENHPGLLTVIAPRHPERGAEIAGLLRAEGAKPARRSQGEPISAEVEIYLADTLGELGLFYRLAAAAFIGGSLVPHGGHNPLEAAKLGCPALFGPHTGNFEEMTGKLLQAGAARRVRDASDLRGAIDRLLADPAECQRMAERGRAAGATETAVLDLIKSALAPLLERQLDSHACA